MFYLKVFIFLLVGGAFGMFDGNTRSSIPPAVAIGGAVVAAVEDDAVRMRERKDMKMKSSHDTEKPKAFTTSDEVEEGRKKKYHKKNKILKFLYPLVIGSALAKVVVVPLVLMALTGLSTSSFAMAKIALVASGLLVLKWIFAEAETEHTRFEIVQAPSKGNGNHYLNDLSWSGSNFVDIKTPAKQRLKYIPLESSSTGQQTAYLINKGIGTSDYRYGYDNILDGKPFL